MERKRRMLCSWNYTSPQIPDSRVRYKYPMPGIKKTYSPEFKNRVELELIREVDTISQICSAHSIHPTQANQWKQQALQSVAQSFVGKPEVSLKEKEDLIGELYKQIGQLKVEVDWLKKKT